VLTFNDLLEPSSPFSEFSEASDMCTLSSAAARDEAGELLRLGDIDAAMDSDAEGEEED
jgi:hypothetical protein